jgi:hypothetical protein
MDGDDQTISRDTLFFSGADSPGKKIPPFF